MINSPMTGADMQGLPASRATSKRPNRGFVMPGPSIPPPSPLAAGPEAPTTPEGPRGATGAMVEPGITTAPAPTAPDPVVQSWVAPVTTDPTELVALSHLLRCAATQRALLASQHVDTAALAGRMSTQAGAALVSAAALIFARDKQCPVDPQVWAVEAERYQAVQDQATGVQSDPGFPHALDELLSCVFDPALGVISETVGREAWADWITDRIVAPGLRDYAEAGADSSSIEAAALDDMLKLRTWVGNLRSGITDDRQRLQPYTMRQLAAEARPPRWLVLGVLVHGQTVYIGGLYKSIKSGIALDLAVSVAMRLRGTAIRFLDRYPCEPAKHVLVFTGEADKWGILQKVCAIYDARAGLPMGNRRQQAAGHHPALDLGLTFYFNVPRMSVADDRKIVQDEIRRCGADVVIVDPLYLAALSGTNIDPSSIFAMGGVLKAIEDVILDEGATPIFIHHFVKSIKTGDEPKLGHLSQSGSAERAGQWMLINHRVPFDEANGCARLMLLFGGRSGQAGRLGVDIVEGQLNDDFTGRGWSTTVMSLAAAQAADAQAGLGGRQNGGAQELRYRILGFLAAQPEGAEPICATPLSRGISANGPACNVAIGQLVTEGLVERMLAAATGLRGIRYRITPAGRDEVRRMSGAELSTFDPGDDVSQQMGGSANGL